MAPITYGKVLERVFSESKSLPPVASTKNPLVAFAIGFLFGPLGIGVYFLSIADFLVLLGLVLLGSVMTAGLALPIFWMICGAWGYVRVRCSKRSLAETPPIA